MRLKDKILFRIVLPLVATAAVTIIVVAVTVGVRYPDWMEATGALRASERMMAV